jgi:hypothetical protein
MAFSKARAPDVFLYSILWNRLLYITEIRNTRSGIAKSRFGQCRIKVGDKFGILTVLELIWPISRNVPTQFQVVP